LQAGGVKGLRRRVWGFWRGFWGGDMVTVMAMGRGGFSLSGMEWVDW
jgi:hypothetical protein